MLPDDLGHFGDFGGRYVPETLVPALDELNEVYALASVDDQFKRELDCYLTDYVGRPTPLYFAQRLTELLGGPKIYIKREDLCHTGAHKINNAIGQALLAKRMKKHRVIAETGAGQHGVATATACALFGLDCEVYMGEEDIHRQALNVYRMKLLGAKVIPVTSGTKTLKDATSEAIRDWVTNVRSTHYIIGSVIGPHPYPRIVRDFQSVIGKETRRQCLEKERRLPDAIIACVGGGSNAMGIFYPFIEDKDVRLIGVEAAGKGLDSGEHCATLTAGEPGVLHGCKSFLLQDEDGQISLTHSISAGLDYPGVGPEHSFLKTSGRAEYYSITDAEAMEGFKMLAEKEGLIAALESSHAMAYLMKIAPAMNKETFVVLNLSGRGDKDMDTICKVLRIEL